jgi:hypothetical protein
VKHVPDVTLGLLAALVIFILYLHFTDGSGSSQRVAPRQSDLARLQIMEQTANAQVKKQMLKARRNR